MFSIKQSCTSSGLRMVFE